jgi:hypothetical protein
MENSTPKPTAPDDHLDNVRDLLAAANHMRAVAVRTDCAALHALADRIGALPLAFYGVTEQR